MDENKYPLNIHNYLDRTHFDNDKKYMPVIMSEISATKVKTTVLACLSRLYDFDLTEIDDNLSHLFILNDTDHNVIAIIVRKYTVSMKEGDLKLTKKGEQVSPNMIDLCDYTLFSIGYREKTWSDLLLEGFGVTTNFFLKSFDITEEDGFPNNLDTHLIAQLIDRGYIWEIDGVFYSSI